MLKLEVYVLGCRGGQMCKWIITILFQVKVLMRYTGVKVTREGVVSTSYGSLRKLPHQPSSVLGFHLQGTLLPPSCMERQGAGSNSQFGLNDPPFKRCLWSSSRESHKWIKNCLNTLNFKIKCLTTQSHRRKTGYHRLGKMSIKVDQIHS